MLRSRILLLLLSICAGAASAQRAPTYQLAVGDTLRFAERTDGLVTITSLQGTLTVRTEHAATLAIIRTSPREAQAWYETLHLRQEGPASMRKAPDTGPLLRQPFAIDFPPDGRVALVSAPDIPDEISSMTDLTRQFDDFFISLPPNELAPGIDWADTTHHTRAGRRPSDTAKLSMVRRYRVARDTMIAGAHGVIIEVTQDARIEGSSPMDGMQSLTATVVLEGGDTGIAVFSPSTGRLHSRSRTGRFQGQLTITGGPQPVSMPQTWEYTSVIEAAR